MVANGKVNDWNLSGGIFACGDPGGQGTVLRTYWNNQKTGIVDDEVAELMMEPKNWGELIFKE